MPLSKKRDKPDLKAKPFDYAQAKLLKAGLTMDGNRILDALQSTTSLLKIESNGNLPVYNVEELDGSGQPVPDYW